jgi:hydroxypyruvate reductase
VVTLMISDVPGDDPSVIASGPTVADPSTCADALAILERYRIELPAPVLKALNEGQLETPKPGAPVFATQQLHMIATPMQSLQAAAELAGQAGLPAYILSDEIEGESRDVGKVHAALARAIAQGNGPFQRPCVLLSGGETTVTVKPLPAGAAKGRGGRAGEFCMGLAEGLQGQSGVWALAADTDGIDGVQDNAGARVSPDTLQRATSRGMKLSSYQARNDAYGFFEPLGDLVFTGPTHTNVNDFRAILIT